MADKKNLLLRIDPVLWDELRAWAADELRSVNGQIEYLLTQAARRRRTAAGADAKPDENVPHSMG
jgi:hypothetical protein